MVVNLPIVHTSSNRKDRNALFVAPENPESFWRFTDALAIAGKMSAFQPAGPLAVAGQMPANYNLRLVDMNVTPLTDRDLEWADVVLPSGMIIHFNSMNGVIRRANQFEVPVLVGGPLPTQYAHEMEGNATFFQGESETGFQDILEDIVRRGYVPERRIVDRRKDFRSLKGIPPQRFDLIADTMNQYADMAIQVTRGCPEKCTFCNIPALFGKTTRLKDGESVLEELNILYDMGWRGGVMVTDDNIVGNQEAIRPRFRIIGDWQEERGYPFSLFGQASLRMHDNPGLMEDMRYAGFTEVFMGLESPSPDSLKSMGAQKNISRKAGEMSMLDKVLDIQRNYFRVMSGFILGFDTDPDNISDMMKKFIDESRVGIAMVGPLGILPDTPDWNRYSRAGRLVEGERYSGDSGIFSRHLSFVPHDRYGNEIDPSVILDRHKDVVSHINSPEEYFKRSLLYLQERERKPLAENRSDLSQVPAFLRSLWQQGVRSDYKKTYWNYLLDVVMNDRKDLADAVHYAAQGHHFINTTRKALKVDEYHPHVKSLLEKYKTKVGDFWDNSGREVHERLDKISRWGNRVKRKAQKKYDKLDAELRGGAQRALDSVHEGVDNIINYYMEKA